MATEKIHFKLESGHTVKATRPDKTKYKVIREFMKAAAKIDGVEDEGLKTLLATDATEELIRGILSEKDFNVMYENAFPGEFDALASLWTGQNISDDDEEDSETGK